jgi:hypothetical protein
LKLGALAVYLPHGLKVDAGLGICFLIVIDGNALKYLMRFKDKGGVEDLRKAKHYIEKLIEMETTVRTEDECNDDETTLKTALSTMNLCPA